MKVSRKQEPIHAFLSSTLAHQNNLIAPVMALWARDPFRAEGRLVVKGSAIEARFLPSASQTAKKHCRSAAKAVVGMRHTTSPVCCETPSTSYSCNRNLVAPKHRPRALSCRRGKDRLTALCTERDQDSQTQDAWNRLELITRCVQPKRLLRTTSASFAISAGARGSLTFSGEIFL